MRGEVPLSNCPTLVFSRYICGCCGFAIVRAQLILVENNTRSAGGGFRATRAFLAQCLAGFYFITSNSNDRNQAGKIQAQRRSYSAGLCFANLQISLFTIVGLKMIFLCRVRKRLAV